jgi:hypothetical protein
MIERLWRWCSSEMVFPHPKRSLQNSRENDSAMMISIGWYEKWSDRTLLYHSCKDQWQIIILWNFVIPVQTGISWLMVVDPRLREDDRYKIPPVAQTLASSFLDKKT